MLTHQFSRRFQERWQERSIVSSCSPLAAGRLSAARSRACRFQTFPCEFVERSSRTMHRIAEISRDNVWRSRGTVITSEPQAQPVQPRKQDSLINICLIEFVADFLFKLRRNENSMKQFLVIVEPAAGAQ